MQNNTSGNITTTHTDNTDYKKADNKALLTEHSIYGQGRIGMYYRQNNISSYEIKDHLGNVRVVIQKDNNSGIFHIPSYTDYYSTGMPIPSRSVTGNYKYGYQGEFAEKDEETGLTTFKLRMYDPRIGRWLTTDP